MGGIHSSKESRIVRILRKYVEPDLLASIPPDILNSLTFPYNADRTERWCYACKAFRNVSEFYTQGRKLATRCKRCKVPSEIRRGRNLKHNYGGSRLKSMKPWCLNKVEYVLSANGLNSASCEGNPYPYLLTTVIPPTRYVPSCALSAISPLDCCKRTLNVSKHSWLTLSDGRVIMVELGIYNDD